jgi:hypothetical protein
MNSITLGRVLESLHHKSYERTVSDIVFDTLKTLYDLKRSQHLSPESMVFLSCKNAIDHMATIVERVFVDREEIELVISEELAIVLAESPVIPNPVPELRYLITEELQGSTRASLEAIDSLVNDVREKTYEVIRMEREVLQESFERAVYDRDPIDEVIGTAIGTLVPAIVLDVVRPIIAQNQRLLALAEAREENQEKKHTESIKRDLAQIKEKLGIPPVIRIPKPKHKSEKHRAQKRDDDDEGMF